MAEAKTKTPDMCPCGGCKKLFPHWKVDAVLLDEDGNQASAHAYCRGCWPRFKRIACDEFREGDPDHG